MSDEQYEPSFRRDAEKMIDPLRWGKMAWDDYEPPQDDAHPLDFIRDVDTIALRIENEYGGTPQWLAYDVTQQCYIHRRGGDDNTETKLTREGDETLLESYIDSGHWWPWDYSVSYPTALTGLVDRNNIQSEPVKARRPVFYEDGFIGSGARNAALTEEYLQREYIEKDRTASDIADERDVETQSVHQRASSLGLRKKTPVVLEESYLQREYIEKDRTASDIADEKGVETQSVHQRASQLGLRKKNPVVLEESYLQREYIEKDRTASDIADEKGVKQSKVYYYARKYNFNKYE